MRVESQEANPGGRRMPHASAWVAAFLVSVGMSQEALAAKSRHPAAPAVAWAPGATGVSGAKSSGDAKHCMAWFSPGMGEVAWQLTVLDDSVEFAALSMAWPGQDGDTVTAVWRHRNVTVEGGRLCNAMAAAPWGKAEPPVLDGAVYGLRFGGAQGLQEKVLGHAPGNGERFSALLAAIDSLGERSRRFGTLVFALRWTWQGQKSDDQVVPVTWTMPSNNPQAALRVRRDGVLLPAGVTARLRFGRETWERQFPGPPPLDTSATLPAACLLGAGKGGDVRSESEAKGKGGEPAWDRCPVNLPAGWKAAQVVAQGTLPLLAGPQSFQAASAFLVKE